MFRIFIVIGIFSLVTLLANAWSVVPPFNSKIQRFKWNHAIANSLAITLLTNTFPPSAAVAIDAFDAATRAMLEKKEKVVVTQEFNSLNPTAQKRKALALCKVSSTRENAGFSSANDCTKAVILGNFDIINAPKDAIPVKAVSNKTPKVAATVNSVVPTKRSGAKVNDFSDLTTAQKKRRALAACKRPEVRKFAGMGSESKCTTSVNRDNFQEVIEALEYGL